MSTATIDERGRLRDLYALKILDTMPEERFDRYTRLVADIFDVPFCEITLIDEHRLWFKSTVGTGREEVPREESICAHFLEYELLEIPDTLADPIFRAKPTTTGPLAVRFYAGALLHGPEGQPVGRLCLLDTNPRQLTEKEQRRLQAFAQLIEQELEFNHRLDRARRELTDQVLFDPATHAPGPLLSEEQLGELVAEAREEGSHVAVAVMRFLAYDEFIATYGPETLDEVARMYVHRGIEQVGPHGLVGRLANDRMLVAAIGFEGTAEARAWVRQMYVGVTQAYSVGEGRRSDPISAGVSLLPEDAETARELIDHARLAGDTTSPGLHFYTSGTDRYVQRRDRMIARLSRALEEGVVTLVFQPVFRTDDGRVVTCEALARWTDGELGFVSPGEFIPVVEANPVLSRLLTRHVLREACRAAKQWNDGRASPVAVNVNIAGPEFHSEDFINEIEAVLEETGLPRELLVIELTEQTVIGDLAEAQRIMRELRNLGTRFALDDFGTGYSSLSYLRRLPFDVLKIDRSFVSDLPDDETALEVARGIVNIGKALRMRIVAEGVETESQRAGLTGIGCDGLQGFLLGKPMPLEEVIRVME